MARVDAERQVYNLPVQTEKAGGAPRSMARRIQRPQPGASMSAFNSHLCP